jgi:hypothetical protein
MKALDCAGVRARLGAFVDGELKGVEMILVSKHLDTCADCSQEVESLQELGDLLRASSTVELPPQIDGLAGGVISRIGAESAVSWRALVNRAFDSWHWALVGCGSLVATFITTSFVGAVLTFGPAPSRADSLSALITNLGTPAGLLFVYATPAERGADPLLMQFDNGEPDASAPMAALASPWAARQATEREMVEALAGIVTPRGRWVGLEAMPPADRRYAELLFDEINRLRMNDPMLGAVRVNVHEVRLVTSTSVSAKGL